MTHSKGWTASLEDTLQRIGKSPHALSSGATNCRSNGSAHASADCSTRSARFKAAFSDDYQALYSPEQAAQDAEVIDALSDEHPLAVRISLKDESSLDSASAGSTFSIAVYQRGKEIVLSKSLPILEHAGFEVLHERSSRICPEGSKPVFLHRFPVRVRGGDALLSQHFAARQKIIESGLEDVFHGKSEDDALNALMTTAGLDSSALSLLRAYCLLLWQVKKFATRQTIREALVNNPILAQQLWEVASVKFDPLRTLSMAERKAEVEAGLAKLREGLRAVSDMTSDRILRSLVLLLQHTVRTNFFRSPAPSLPGPRAGVVALKIHSEHLELLSSPRPLYEIFISAPAFEGVHLRGSRVARGGIRWSDRREDFRTEVRDLMRTQQVKNAIIVPSGAKGGFVVKELPTERAAQAAAVKECYQEFIRSLLSITDNRINGTIVPPEGVVCHDEPDPYLVVAADKGTATFSDVANGIAVEEFNFWLGDAFASGGSNGYDHKKLGITAKGAWEAAKQHFKDARINYEQTPFTVIGIGDMSGDVFGNGLLLSKRMKLLAGFNHKHIFIDPSPDPERSWSERKRLFDTPFSQWSDYDQKALSKGAMIIERRSKEITLTPEARAALGVPADTAAAVSGEQLISLLLRAPADLLWNGGIGTYVKSRSESDADVGDSTNDGVRVNADELRVRIVSEGGNLGFTQRGRIEFSQRGGLINTDAIDNSGGVDTSDHEVNLKILFQSEVQGGRVSKEERDQILRELAPAVVDDVLSHNRGQAVLLASSAKRGSKNLDYFSSLMSELVRRGYLHRTVHMLPSDEELADRVRNGAGLLRPELAVCTAGVKLWIKDELLQSGLTKNPSLRAFLVDYFPAPLHARFAKAIAAHPLADNIIATKVANELVETVGLTFVHRMCISHAVEPAAVLEALLAARALLRTPERREAIQSFDTFEGHEIFLQLRIELSAALREATTWLITNHAREVRLDSLVSKYSTNFNYLLDRPAAVLTGGLARYVSERTPSYLQRGLDAGAAAIFAAAPLTPLLLEVIWTAESAHVKVDEAALVYCTLVDSLGLFPILAAQREVVTTTKWEHELRLNAYDEIRRAISLLAVRSLKEGVRTAAQVEDSLRSKMGMDRMRTAVSELTEARPHVAMLSVFARQLRLFAA